MTGTARNVVLFIVGLIIVGVVVVFGSATFLTEMWWFEELDQTDVFWRLYAWPLGVQAVAAVVLSLLVYANLRLVQPTVARALFRFQERVPEFLTWRTVRRGLAVGSILLGLMASAAVGQQWETVARFVHRTPFAISDPLFTNDVGFYVFELPFYRLLHGTFTGIIGLVLVLVGAIYFVTRGIRWELRTIRIDDRPRRHLLAIGAALVILKAIDYRLSLYGLLFSTSSSTIFGATYTDWHAHAFSLRVLFVLALLVSAVMLWNVFRTNWRSLGAAAIVWLIASILLGGVFPGVLQRFIVEPNELEREGPFIEHHLRFTRLAYGLEAIEEEDFIVDDALTWSDVEANGTILRNARLWDWRPLQRTYGQLQSIRFYYSFPDVDVDRYVVNGELRQVMLAPRELDVRQIPNPTWVNQHLQYTHGYGLAMSPVNEMTAQGLPRFFLSDIPPRARDVDLAVDRPEIYFGEMTNHYVVVGTRTPDFEFSYPSGEDNVRTTYAGTGGVPMGSLFRRAAFAARMNTINLLLSDQIVSDTRILFRRNISERVAHLAPFLRFDADPYAVLADGRMYWIIDGYTMTSAFPYAMPNARWRANYVRNSVKAVVDAYDGSVHFYISDEADPIVQTYAKMFPGLLQPLDDMPPSLQAHMRYPEDLFSLQAEMFSMYHMSNPTIFYNREDVWRFAREVFTSADTARTREQVMTPYYVVMQLPGEPEPEMVLMLPFTPSERNNMIAWMAARMDGDDYGRLLVYRFPKDELIYGPMQIEARIDQHPDISQLLTLWAQLGSHVIRGNMLVLPMERSLLYLKPIYLQAETGDLPALVRVIAAYGDEIAMHPTLDAALRAVIEQDAAAVDLAPPDVLAEELDVLPDLLGDDADVLPDIGGALSPDEAVDREPERDMPPLRAEVARALQLFERAEERLQAGDWAGYGEALAELETLLRELARPD